MVNDGSSYNIKQGKEAILKAVTNAEWLTYKENRGKGFALRKGISKSQGDIILYTDHDFPYSYGTMVSAIRLISDEHQAVVIGHRDADYYKEQPILRIKISHYLKTINRLILGITLDDTQCGLKVFSSEIKPIFLETFTNRFLIDVEFLRRLSKKKIPIVVLPVKIRPGVVLSKISFRTMFREMYSYLQILFYI